MAFEVRLMCYFQKLNQVAYCVENGCLEVVVVARFITVFVDMIRRKVRCYLSMKVKVDQDSLHAVELMHQ